MSGEFTLGVIGGSSFYSASDLLQDASEKRVETPCGFPPDPIVEGWIKGAPGVRVLFTSRHGRGHRLLPSEVPYRAIVCALKQEGARAVIGISAVGSLRDDVRPGDLAVVHQYIDATHGTRQSTFFGGGLVGHIQFADPVCPHLERLTRQASADAGFKVWSGLTLRVMEGPAFSTRAESHRNRSDGADLIGMTSLPEAMLAREAELHHATLALVTDMDCGHGPDDAVSGEEVVACLRDNAEKAREVIRRLAAMLSDGLSSPACKCALALDGAIATSPEFVPTEKKASPIFRDYYRRHGISKD